MLSSILRYLEGTFGFNSKQRLQFDLHFWLDSCLENENICFRSEGSVVRSFVITFQCLLRSRGRVSQLIV